MAQQENLEEQNFLHQPSFLEASIVSVITVALLSFLIIGTGWAPHIGIAFVMLCLLIYGRVKGISYNKMQQAMADSLMSSVGALYLFFFIGILVTALLMSGAIPSLIYYGTLLMSANYFYVSVFLITGIIGISLGSSLTTVATLGVAFMGIGEAFDANAMITAGAIVSGAFLGDKMSPLSDTTTISAATVDIDLFDHIKNMLRTTIPALILCCVIYIGLSSFNHSEVGNIARIEIFRQALKETNLVHLVSLLPFVLLICLAVMRVSAIMAMIYTSLLGVVIAQFLGYNDFSQYGTYFFAGFVPNPEWAPDLVRMFSRGGLQSMFFTLTIVLLAVSMGGLLFALGVIPRLLKEIADWLNNRLRATIAVAMTSVGVNVLIGEQYLSILLSGETFKPIYDRLGLERKHLSRTLEDAGTVVNPLVPWSVCGVFIAQQLNVSVIDYLPYAFFCYLSVLITLVIPSKRSH
ncbi:MULTISPECIES: Na+/H+ antiporter NhaC family protein [Pasteurellaceae]|uniref:Na+/H+ antiporter NhaC family protein n=1 Tax=Pasteurella atlantica TaxID=2827233 RepID=A0AAW8CJR1_9PAST|nr:Na+/H+ antiporter NhaC family protein [Pasteurella atlantica]MBR0574318.1 Na+/H+ antiporter NhaC [Pasteurella atlantica]MDP8040222.1 Na+/H+ antiporter NhaC family protein [Pasteurella atlantica]MDP8042339.1 Na+/H+ antiporter NhaC family protein [Pasteurella atlantica]MDP8044532.1 Na+/H+ antiporter NhaC family protein [Pasteurella atlantica]MDP8046544.1 Na+/H+ antiporter NhaC family protein [Pasteurella atlantica]